jgi:hypothetical protein
MIAAFPLFLHYFSATQKLGSQKSTSSWCGIFLAATRRGGSDVHALGLQTSQGLIMTEAWYWDLNDANREFAKKFAPQNKGIYPEPTIYRKPPFIQKKSRPIIEVAPPSYRLHSARWGLLRRPTLRAVGGGNGIV